ncbi:MAG: ABC transporter ATP-binding protein [Rickettsiales bacterium]
MLNTTLNTQHSTLNLTSITKIYQQAESTLTVLNNLNLEVKKGEVVALVGQSGSGKTTLLQIAGLLDNPTGGEVKINGEDLSSAGDKKRTLTRQKNIGFIYQFHHLLPEFTALENVVLPQMIAGVSRAEAEEKAENLLGQLGLSGRLNHRPAKLSGGEQQRVAVARAMANNPALVLADEPTGNLDPKTAENVFSMFMKLAKDSGQSALVATHNMELARRMDRIVHLEGGVLK